MKLYELINVWLFFFRKNFNFFFFFVDFRADFGLARSLTQDNEDDSKVSDDDNGGGMNVVVSALNPPQR